MTAASQRKLLVSCVMWALAHPVLAQEVAPVDAAGQQGPAAGTPRQDNDAPNPTTLDRVVVKATGTRIPRAGFDTLEPAQVISRQYLDDANITNLADAFSRSPSFGLGASAYGDQSSFGVGVSFASRFGLGSNRLLTLINGRRFVSSNPPTIFGPSDPGNQVDLNVIPTILVDRTENIGIGGAPTYGSDAISGVSNVFLRDRFDGVEVQLGYGLSERGDGQRVNAASLFGTDFAQGRGHFVLALSYDDLEGVPDSSRRFYREGYSLKPNPSASAISRYQPGREAASDGRLHGAIPFDGGPGDGVPGQVYMRDRRLGSITWGGLALPAGRSRDPSGQVLGLGANGDQFLQFDRQGHLVPYDPGVNFGSSSASGGDGVALWEAGQIVSDLDRKTAFLTGHFDFTDNVRGFWEASSYSAQAREIRAQSIYNADGFGRAGLDGSGATSGTLTFSADHPMLTDQARQALADRGVRQFQLSRASRDLVVNNASSLSNVWRVVGGLEGYFSVGGRGFNWEASGVYGRGDFVYSGTGLVQQNFINALNVTRAADGSVACDATAAGTSADPACVPLDLFGEGRASRQALAYVTTPTRATAAMEQTVFNANLTGDIVDLPGGALAFNAGYEFRRDEGAFRPSEYERQGLGRSVAINPTQGRVQSNEFFGELFAPLVHSEAGIPGLHRLDLTAKLRRVNNSVNGWFTAYTYGLQYEPVKGVQLRGNKTRSFRSPALVELYADQAAFYFVSEPCQAANIASGPRPDNRAANCEAFFAAYPGANPATFQGPPASIQGKRVGSTELGNEQADSWTAGLVLQPDWAPGLRMAVDYYRIELSNIIDGIGTDDIQSGCFDADDFGPSNPYCQLVTRNPVTGLAESVNTTYVNGPYINFRGWTAELAYRLDLEAQGWGRGRVDLSFNGYFPQSWERAAAPGIPAVEWVDTRRGQTRTYQWKADYALGRWNFGAEALYTPSQMYEPNMGAESQDYGRVDGYLKLGANVGYRFNERWRMNLAVDNLTDDMGPFPYVDDALGRRYMLTATMKL